MPGAATLADRLTLDEPIVHNLAEKFGTPLYVLSERHLRDKARAFRQAWPGDVSFASKANSTLAVIQVVHSEGCSIDVASEGELRAALAAGVPAKDCHLHGNNKSLQEIGFAVDQRVGQIVVDCFEELDRLRGFGPLPPLVVRLAPGVDPKTNVKISTGQADTKFGFPLADAERAVRFCQYHGLPLIGFHCHVGSQLLDPEAQIQGARAIAQTAVEMLDATGFEATFLNVGGGLGVRYAAADSPMPVPDYCQAVVQALRDTLGGRLDPALGMEPGRAMVAEAGVTLYTVGSVKKAASGRTFVAVDGGLSDNPRPAMYGSKYDLVWHSAQQSNATMEVTVSGKHCETDTLFPDMDAPEGVRAGDLVQVIATGAYNSAMASNYNRLPRPATVMLRENGDPVVVQRRESFDDMLARESLLD